jgi:hypothetical protein
MNPYSPQPETSNLPGTAPTSPQLEASALPGTPQAPPQPTTQEIPLEPEQDSPPIQESKNEVSVNTCSFIFHSINHPLFSKPSFSGPGWITTKLSIYCE